MRLEMSRRRTERNRTEGEGMCHMCPKSDVMTDV